MDSLWEIFLAIVFYAIYAVIEARKQANEEPESPEVEAAHARVLRARLEATEQVLGSGPGWRVVGPVWRHVLLPKVLGLINMAEGSSALTWQLGLRRERLEYLADELERHALAAHAGEGTWIGAALWIALAELEQEGQRVFPAYPDADAIARQKTITRESLQHLYAAWAYELVPDVITAVLDPTLARAQLRLLEEDRTAAQSADNGEPPPYLRGVAIGRALGTSYRGHAPGKELVIATSLGSRFALPEEILRADVEAITDRLVRRAWSGLGNRTLAQLAGRAEPAARRPAPRIARPPARSVAPARPAVKPPARSKRRRRRKVDPAYAQSAAVAVRRPTRAQLREAIVLGEVLRL